MSATALKTPNTLQGATWNMLKERQPKSAKAGLLELLKDYPHLQFVALQETRAYLDVIGRIDGYRAFVKRRPRGADQQAWLVREDILAKRFTVVDLGGDGWTTHDGHHHVGDKAMALTIAGWLRAYNVHRPPSINWPHGKPVGPPERVDDYVDGMRWLRERAEDSPADGMLSNVRQGERYGSDHPVVRFTVERVGDARGLLYVGDWNNRPGRDDGYASVTWLAKEAGMTVGRAANMSGHLHGIDLPLLKVAS